MLVLLFASSAATARGDGGYTPRTGFVTLQFDDSHDYHYTRIFPKLEGRGLKASFGYITETSDLGINHEAWKMQAIYAAGHEVQDHTTRHSYLWATGVDTLDDGVGEWIPHTFASVALWDSLCEASRHVLDCLGIRAYGWNQPGGSGAPGTIPGHPQWTWTGGVNDSLYHVAGATFNYAIAAGVYPNTAHLNLRGHNYPERYPFFNVPHVTIDGTSLAHTRTAIADAVASGLWYLAVSHAETVEQVARAESLIDWVADAHLDVLTCKDGVERVQCGVADPDANQLPQAEMLRDLDGNGKPDGFAGECAWDTLSTPPAGGVRCLRVKGVVEFYCYGPETGGNAFAFWLRSATGSAVAVKVEYAQYDFDWQALGGIQTFIQAAPEWARVDTLASPDLLIDVEDDVDRIRFKLTTAPSESVVIACPDLRHVAGPVAGIGGDRGERGGEAPLVVFPNPVIAGEPLQVGCQSRRETIGLYDALGRCLAVARPLAACDSIEIDTTGLPSGVHFIRDSSAPGRTAKVVILR